MISVQILLRSAVPLPREIYLCNFVRTSIHSFSPPSSSSNPFSFTTLRSAVSGHLYLLFSLPIHFVLQLVPLRHHSLLSLFPPLFFPFTFSLPTCFLPSVLSTHHPPLFPWVFPTRREHAPPVIHVSYSSLFYMVFSRAFTQCFVIKRPVCFFEQFARLSAGPPNETPSCFSVSPRLYPAIHVFDPPM